MTYELEYFKEFHDDPASFSDEDFRTKTLEWMISVRETDGQYDYESEEWEEIGDRFYDELDARFPRTEELEEEYEAIKQHLLEDSAKPGEFVKALRDRRDFVKKYQVEFQFAHAYVKRCEDEFRDVQAIFYELRGSHYEKREALHRLDDNLANFYEKPANIFPPPRSAKAKFTMEIKKSSNSQVRAFSLFDKFC